MGIVNRLPFGILEYWEVSPLHAELEAGSPKKYILGHFIRTRGVLKQDFGCIKSLFYKMILKVFFCSKNTLITPKIKFPSAPPFF